MTDQTRLDEIRARVEAATPGPWEFQLHSHLEDGCRCLSCYMSTGYTLLNPWPCCDEVKHLKDNEECYQSVLPYTDATFIAHSRQDVPYLLDLVASLTAARAIPEAGA